MKEVISYKDLKMNKKILEVLMKHHGLDRILEDIVSILEENKVESETAKALKQAYKIYQGRDLGE